MTIYDKYFHFKLTNICFFCFYLLCLSAIFVIRHVLGLPLILGLWLFSRMTDNDGAEGDESLRQLQHLCHFCGAVFVRIETSPDCTKSEGISCKKDILRSCRAVLNPEPLSWTLCHIQRWPAQPSSAYRHVGCYLRVQRVSPCC